MQVYFDSTEWQKSYAQELGIFGIMSDKKDLKFILLPDRERSIEDYIRMLCITKIFGFYRIFKKLVYESGEKLTKICTKILRLKYNKKVFIKWMTDYIDGVEDADLKAWAAESWEEAQIIPTQIIIMQIVKIITCEQND